MDRGDAEFDAVRLEQARRILQRCSERSARASREEESACEELDAQWQEIVRLAVQLARVPARSPELLVLKANLLLDVIEDDPSDVTSLLARSLCSDILNIDHFVVKTN